MADYTCTGRISEAKPLTLEYGLIKETGIRCQASVFGHQKNALERIAPFATTLEITDFEATPSTLGLETTCRRVRTQRWGQGSFRKDRDWSISANLRSRCKCPMDRMP